MKLCVNFSDHVHYYQGGKPFEYILYDPVKGELNRFTLGPNVHQGHTLQVCVEGGIWKCGSIVGYGHDAEEEDFSESSNEYDEYDYSLIGEAVAPGTFFIQTSN